MNRTHAPATESGCYRVVLAGEALRNVCRQHGIVEFDGETDESLNARLASVTTPQIGVQSQYP